MNYDAMQIYTVHVHACGVICCTEDEMVLFSQKLHNGRNCTFIIWTESVELLHPSSTAYCNMYEAKPSSSLAWALLTLNASCVGCDWLINKTSWKGNKCNFKLLFLELFTPSLRQSPTQFSRVRHNVKLISQNFMKWWEIQVFENPVQLQIVPHLHFMRLKCAKPSWATIVLGVGAWWDAQIFY